MSRKRKTPAELAAIEYESAEWHRMTLADHAEAWAHDRGRRVPRDRRTKAWAKMYEEWVDWAFAPLMATIPKSRRLTNPTTLTGHRLGDFIEFFGDEAKVVSRVAGITLTKTLPRHGSVPIAGFPAHVLSTFRPILKAAGYGLRVTKGWPKAMLARGGGA